MSEFVTSPLFFPVISIRRRKYGFLGLYQKHEIPNSRPLYEYRNLSLLASVRMQFM